MIGPSRTRTRSIVAAAVIAVVSVVGFGSTSSNALPDGVFEATDGDLVGTLDWAAAATAGELVCEPVTSIVNCGIDKPTGGGDDSFGQGTKEDTAVPTVVDGSIPNNKSDLTRFYVASNDRTIGGELKNFVYLAWERVQEPTGTTNMDFEFNQSTVVSGNGITPVRTPGDLLIKFDLAQGGTNPAFGYHVWSGSAWGPVNALTGFALGSVNTVAVDDPIEPNATRSLSPRTFGEASINLTDAGLLDPDNCTSFGRAYLKSRSSDSFTAALKDFIAPIPVSVTNCRAANIALVKYDTKGTSGTTADDVLLAGATLQLWVESNGTAGVQTTGLAQDTLVGSCVSSTTANDPNCTFSITTSGTYYGVESVAPAGYNSAPTVTQVITIGNVAQNFSFVFRDSPAPATINVHKQDDAGNPLAGAVFTLYKDVAPESLAAPGVEDKVAANSLGTCTTQIAPLATPPKVGDCSFTNVPLGSYWVVETAAPSAAYNIAPPQRVVVGLGANVGEGQVKNLTFVDSRKHRIIVLVCHEGTNTLVSSNVTMGAQVKPSLGSSATPSEATLCALGGATFGNRPHATTAISVNIAGH